MEETKRVKYIRIERDRIVSGESERIVEGAQILGRFFFYFHNHLPSPVLKRDSAYFYCGLPSTNSLIKHEVKDINISVSDVQIPDVFYDYRDYNIDVSVLPPQDVFRILVNQRVAGYYFVRSNILLATDWTHNAETIRVLSCILNLLPFKEMRKRKEKRYRIRITIGADPEFEIVKSGKVISARNVISGGTGSSEKIGKDGAGYQVEFRPDPASSVFEAVKNFRKLLIEFSKSYPDLRLSCQGDVYPLGGHIHIGAPFTYDFLVVLDNWIGKYVINLSGSARGSYRKLSAYETKNWGFE
jgi:hypothetical protein